MDILGALTVLDVQVQQLQSSSNPSPVDLPHISYLRRLRDIHGHGNNYMPHVIYHLSPITYHLELTRCDWIRLDSTRRR